MENMENINKPEVGNEEDAKREKIKDFFNEKAKEANMARLDHSGEGPDTDEDIYRREIEYYKMCLYNKMAETGEVLSVDDLLELDQKLEHDSKLSEELHHKFWNKAVDEVANVRDEAEKTFLN
ncbi:MAG: hypothetical protein V1692_00580 [bacterium]